MPRLAVVIPAKNEERYLSAVLEALKKQTRQPDEIIVADGGSTDSTRDIAREFGVTLVAGGSVAEGRNAGAKASTSDLLFFLDADVLIDSADFIERALDDFLARQLDVATADVVIPQGNFFDQLSIHFYNWYVRLWGARHPHLAGFCILIRRSVHERIHGFDPAITFGEDHDYGLKARDAGFRFGVLNKVQIGITTRRQERDGRLRMTLVYLLAEPYIFLFGAPRKNIFHYGFGHEKKK